MNQRPVLFPTLKDIGGRTFEKAYGMLQQTISKLCIEHAYLADSSKVDCMDRECFLRLKNRAGSDVQYAVDTLLRMMAFHYGKSVILLIDEYNVPLAKASDYGYYEDMMDVMRVFLGMVWKTNPALKFAIVTGCLRIAKESIFTGADNFISSSISGQRYHQYFGFTEPEVRQMLEDAGFPEKLDEMKQWYDGYHVKTGKRLYNPRSVVMALSNNNLGNYWRNSGPYDEIYYYMEHNVDTVRESLALMISGYPVPVKIREYAAVSQNLETKEEIFSAMVVYGFLSYENGSVSIPNRELMEKFSDMLQKEPSLGYVYRLAKESQQMLQATLAGRTEIMEEILQRAHNTETPLLSYNHEVELTAVVNLVYLAARDNYRVEREERAGIGYVDFIFYPETDRNADGIILELKVDHTLEEAIQQIREKQYALRFRERLGEKRKYTGRVLGVGIGYDKAGKTHRCKVEVL